MVLSMRHRWRHCRHKWVACSSNIICTSKGRDPRCFAIHMQQQRKKQTSSRPWGYHPWDFKLGGVWALVFQGCRDRDKSRSRRGRGRSRSRGQMLRVPVSLVWDCHPHSRGRGRCRGRGGGRMVHSCRPWGRWAKAKAKMSTCTLLMHPSEVPHAREQKGRSRCLPHLQHQVGQMRIQDPITRMAFMGWIRRWRGRLEIPEVR